MIRIVLHSSAPGYSVSFSLSAPFCPGVNMIPDPNPLLLFPMWAGSVISSKWKKRLNKFWSRQFQARVLWLLKFQWNSIQVLNFVSFILMITIKSRVLLIFNHNSHRNKTALKYSGITDNGIKLILIDKSKLLFHT